MSSLGSLSDLADYFDTKIEYLTDLLKFRSLPSGTPLLTDLSEQLTYIEQSIQEVIELPEELSNIRAVLEPLRTYAARQSDYIDKLEACLPKPVSRPPPQSRPQTAPSAHVSTTSSHIVSDDSPPFIPIITQAQLDAIPQYLKQRNTVVKVNNAISDINKLLKKKYILLKKGNKSGKYRDLIAEWSALGGSNCFTFNDLKDLTNIKADPKGKQMLDLLRHLNLINEVREDGCDYSKYIVH
ncbi:hypothetical protein P9112_002463 [Eukaryota sp. TZLM1-RC]